MKRILAIALAFLTLVAGALLAPAATAAEKIETKDIIWHSTLTAAAMN